MEGAPAGSTIEYTGNHQIDAGTYTITAKVTHPNYKELTKSAQLTINKAQQKISFAEIGTVSRDAGRVVLNASASSGLPLKLTGDDNLVATVSGGELLVHRLGTVRLTATQEGNRNYEAATPVSITVRISDKGNGSLRVHQALSPNGDGINDFLIIEGIKDFPDNKLIVFTPNGHRVFSINGYDNESRIFKGIGDFNSSGGTLPQGTYFYVLEYKHEGERKVKKGWFVLKM